MTGIRLRRLDLTRYGHFEGVSLDFGPARDCDVTLIYGDNEAGKSTAFAAWLDVVFGMARRNHPYDFRFGRAELEVGALLDTAQGPLHLRRSVRGLMDGAGHPLEETHLGPLRAGLDRDAFASRFSLNDASLREGGQAIAGGKGDLGEALHVGASGRAGLGAALRDLQGRADAFHRKGGRTTTLRQAKEALKTLATDIAAAELAPEGWARRVAAFETAGQVATEAKAALARAERACDLCERAARLRVLDAEGADLETQLSGLPEGPPLPKGAEGTHATLAARLDQASRALTEAEDQISRETAALTALGISDPPDQPATWFAEALAQVEAAMEAERALAEARSRLEERAGAVPDGPDSPLDLQALEEALAAAPPAARPTEAREALAKARQVCVEAVVGLPGDWAAHVAEGLPEPAEITALLEDLSGATRDAADLAARLAEARADLGAKARALQAAERLPDLIRVADRDAARAARDAAWDAHRHALDAQSADHFAAAMRRDDAVQSGFAQGEAARARVALAREAVDEAVDVEADLQGRRDAVEAGLARQRERFARMAGRLGFEGADPPPAALPERLERLRGAALASAQSSQCEQVLNAALAAEETAMARLGAAMGLPEGEAPPIELRAQAARQVREGDRQNALWSARAAAKHRLTEAQAELSEQDRASKAARARLSDLLGDGPLASLPLPELRGALNLAARLAKALAEAKTARAESDAARADLSRLLNGQGSDQIAPLLERDRLREAHQTLMQERARLVARDGPALDQELAETDPDRPAALRADRQAAETRLTDALTDLGAAQRDRDLAWQEGGADQLRQARANQLATLETEARMAAVAALGALLGRRALAAYEAQTRGALLEDTQAAFARLTGGAWTQLSTDADGRGGQALYASTGEGRTRIDALSTGTQGQIYLALRLAGYGLFVRDHGARPFVLDDVAETFDDTRAQAALTLLGELGGRGQAIFLTHHRHLIEMAQDALPGARVLELPPR